jgi:2-iminobutanoate/2-iminopropanoate deaminase
VSQRQIVSTERAPAAVGNYNQAIIASGTRTLYASGQIGLIPGKPELGVVGDVEHQSKLVLDNLAAVPEPGGRRFA